MNLKKCYLTKNDCYKAGRKIKPKAILVHSTGAANTSLSRYVQPDDGKLGKNKYNNDWNRGGINTCVHAFIGKLADGSVATYQTLPWDHRSWGCGSGKKGSYNDTHIQFEICEDNGTDKKYFEKAYKEAVELCAYLCKQYNLKPADIVSHAEAYKLGYASNHSDADSYFKKYGKTMKNFRADVEAKMKEQTPAANTVSFKVKINTDSLTIRKGAGTSYDAVGTVKRGEVYTIVEKKMNGTTEWGKLLSGVGYISLKYTVKC